MESATYSEDAFAIAYSSSWNLRLRTPTWIGAFVLDGADLYACGPPLPADGDRVLLADLARGLEAVGPRARTARLEGACECGRAAERSPTASMVSAGECRLDRACRCREVLRGWRARRGVPRARRYARYVGILSIQYSPPGGTPAAAAARADASRASPRARLRGSRGGARRGSQAVWPRRPQRSHHHLRAHTL